MEYTSKEELYMKLIPVFNVKQRLMKYYKNSHITNKDLWIYLIETKWKKTHNLTISDIVNDIILIDPNLINEKQ